MIYGLSYDEVTKFMDETLTAKDSEAIINIIEELPSCTSHGKQPNNWDMSLIDKESLDALEIILYKNNFDFTLVDMTEQYDKEDSVLTDVFVKDINNYIDSIFTLDEVLERVFEVGKDNITKFEKLFLDRTTNEL